VGLEEIFLLGDRVVDEGGDEADMLASDDDDFGVTGDVGEERDGYDMERAI
jgi:hypothetical protein